MDALVVWTLRAAAGALALAVAGALYLPYPPATFTALLEPRDGGD